MRGDGGVQPGRRCRPRALTMDGERRSRLRYLGDGCCPLRRLGDTGLYQCQGARELLAPVQDPLSERGVAGGPAAAHDTDLRSAARGACSFRGILRARASALVCAFRCAGAGKCDVPPLERAYARGRECRAVQERVGLIETSNYGKIEISGPGAADWLSRIMANRVPAVGRIALTPMLNDRGKLIGDFTMC